jgi:putative transposase
MLDTTHLTELFDRLGTPDAGRKLVLKARIEAPVRPVKSRGGNVITVLVSRKMGCEISTESRHIEFAAAVDHEFDARVLEYYAQPCELRLELFDPASGDLRTIRHYPDFLVLREDGITLEEWKSVQKLTRLAEKQPYRYERDADGRWLAPQIERALAEFGITYRIYSEEAIPRRRVENLLHLADYCHPAAEPCLQSDVERLTAVLAEHGSCTLDFLMAAPHAFSADVLLKAIADHLVVADLDRDLLSDTRRARLYRDETLRDFMAGETHVGAVPGQERFVFEIAEGARFSYGSQELTISLVGEKDVVCTRQAGATLNLTRAWMEDALERGSITAVAGTSPLALDLARHTKEDLDIALQRKAILESETPVKGASDRTQRRWRAREHAAQANGAHEVLALVPRTYARGNRSPRLTERQEEVMQEVIATKWRSSEAINFKACYRWLVLACEEAGVKTPSYPTFIACVKQAETSGDLRIRHGKRMAYQQGEFVEVLYADTPAHGSRPFQYVHIDHTQLDIELVSSRSGKPLGRPWLSLAVDAWSRRIVALHLTFDAPSYHSVMMVIRDMVRRFGRLPEFVVVDNGRDFMSAAFESFLQVMGVHLRFRPAGQPRHGAVLERLFGRVHSEYVHNLAGNTKATKNVRMVTGKHLPVNFAEWTLEAMYFGLEYWATEYYDQEPHVALDCSPREAFQRGLRENGARPQRLIQFNRDFLIATCPPVDRQGVRLVNRQRGVKVSGLFYWCQEFRDPRVAGQNLPVRYDPWDASSVYVRLKDRWVQATCRVLIGLGQLTDLERRSLTEEYTRRSGTSLDDEGSAQRIREFMQVLTPEGALAIALERQQENKHLFNALQLGCITPVAPVQQRRLSQDIPQADTPSAGIRSSKATPSARPPEADAPDDLPDFDTF